ncbi:MAG: Holliday junction branch migration protein RuvA [Saprospirales bacterium]|nr:Holliday junction branch migration protein RuvA [Saprospirales bacterium]MBK7337410.1 Holliday junction branch migration protein RuvA [Saprospirales bacterium]
MIHHINGLITFKTPTYVVVEAGGLGYKVYISLNTYARIESLEHVKLLTYFHVKEDGHSLFGFSDEQERTLFTHLISVSGIGPATAQLVLSSLSTDEIRSAILSEDDRQFNRVKGIGPKTAKRIILELKDKVQKDAGEDWAQSPSADNTIRQEALSALLALGFSRIPIQKALNQIIKEHPDMNSVEKLIKMALQHLS